MPDVNPDRGGIQVVSIKTNLTADTGSAQDATDTTLTTWNVFDTVGTGGDSTTLPVSAGKGHTIVIKNNAAANAMDVFPNTGGCINSGTANAAVSIPAGATRWFVAETEGAATNWETFGGPEPASISAAAAMTTVGANTGTSGAGLTLIGDTSTGNRSAEIMNDLVALQEDVVELRTQLNLVITALT